MVKQVKNIQLKVDVLSSQGRDREEKRIKSFDENI